jgi:hypothetical protein
MGYATTRTNKVKESDTVYARIMPKLNEWGACTRIDNALVGSVPDIHYCVDGIHGWIEGKQEKRGELYFEKFQLPWVIKYRRANTRHLLLAVCPDYHPTSLNIYDYTDVVDIPRYIKGKWTVVKAIDLPRLLLLEKPFNWDALRVLLTR